MLILRRLLHFVLAAEVLKTLVAGQEAPPNDFCEDATVLPMPTLDTPVVVEGTTRNATIDAGTTFCSLSINAPGVWYQVEGDGNILVASTCNAADFDTKISVYTGSCGVGTQDCIVAQDDTTNCANLTTEVTFPTVQGETYRILVHGVARAYLGYRDNGDFTLSLFSMLPQQAPSNDECLNAELLATPTTANPVQFTANTRGASLDAGFNRCNRVSITAPGVWYQVIGDGTTFRASSCWNTDYDNKVSVYLGCDFPGVCVAANDDSGNCGSIFADVTWPTVVGERYLILVHGYSGNQGESTFTLSTDGIPVSTPAPTASPSAMPSEDSSCTNADDSEALPQYIVVEQGGQQRDGEATTCSELEEYPEDWVSACENIEIDALCPAICDSSCAAEGAMACKDHGGVFFDVLPGHTIPRNCRWLSAALHNRVQDSIEFASITNPRESPWALLIQSVHGFLSGRDDPDDPDWLVDGMTWQDLLCVEGGTAYDVCGPTCRVCGGGPNCDGSEVDLTFFDGDGNEHTCASLDMDHGLWSQHCSGDGAAAIVCRQTCGTCQEQN